MMVALDTNILVYVEGVNAGPRHQQAQFLLSKLPQEQIALPAQAIGELFNVLTRKARRPAADARLACGQWATAYTVIPTSADVLNAAFALAETHRFASWDAIIFAAAALAGCRYLLSEDMQNGFSWRGTTIANPFASTTLPAQLNALLSGDR